MTPKKIIAIHKIILDLQIKHLEGKLNKKSDSLKILIKTTSIKNHYK